MNYTDVTSPFILERMRNTSWENRKLIDDLIHLWQLVVKPPSNYSGGMALSILRAAYPDEYLALLEEHSPELMKQELEQRLQLEKAFKELQESYENELLKSQELWFLAGGKP